MGERLDKFLVSQKHVTSRVRAKALIEEGKVVVGGVVVTEPDAIVADGTAIEIHGAEFPWVSRGALKLIAALDHFGVDPSGKAVLDLGASTGGFTEVLLSRGAVMVYAVDVGHGQLHPQLQNDGRVVNLEGTDARDLTSQNFRGPLPLIVGDLSFISLKHILPTIWQLMGIPSDAVLLLKPQFEVGKGKTKKGIVTDKKEFTRVCKEVIADAEKIGFKTDKPIESPVKGGSGNTEYLIHLRKTK